MDIGRIHYKEPEQKLALAVLQRLANDLHGKCSPSESGESGGWREDAVWTVLERPEFVKMWCDLVGQDFEAVRRVAQGVSRDGKVKGKPMRGMFGNGGRRKRMTYPVWIKRKAAQVAREGGIVRAMDFVEGEMRVRPSISRVVEWRDRFR